MKLAITGHTSGLGKFLFEYYSKLGHDVKGFSRSNGYDLEKDYLKVIEESIDSDIFFNNAYSSDKQEKLILGLANRIPKIVVSGSEIRKFPNYINQEYFSYKSRLHEVCEYFSKDTECRTDILHLGISFLENKKDKVDHVIYYADIVSLINVWILHPNISDVSFNYKMDSKVLSLLDIPEHKKLPHLS